MPTQIEPHVVLMIEHDTPLGDKLLSMLKAAGYRCHFVRDEKNSIDVIKELKPDLLVLDMAWPGIDGFEILEAKKADRAIAGIPVIALSNQPAIFDAKRATSLGVSDQVVGTTINAEQVVEKIGLQFMEASAKAPAKSKTSAPADAAEADTAAAPATSHAALQGKKILWVEDDKFLGNIIKKRLTKSGCDMFLATNGTEALDYLTKNMPHVIVLDLVLPGMSGFDILKKIRDDQNFKAVPILVLSNLNQSGDIERAKILGAEKFLVKAAASLDQIVREVEMLAK